MGPYGQIRRTCGIFVNSGHFHTHFLELKCYHLDSNLTEICFWVIDQQVNIGSDDGLARRWRQAIIQINNDVIHQRIYASPGLSDSTHWGWVNKGAICGRRHFQLHFIEWKYLNSNENFTEVCALGSNQQYSSIGSDNGLIGAV